MSEAVNFPKWPPGFWRRIILQPGTGWIAAALEDDAHSFRLRLDHAGGQITSVHGRALRHPWSACPGAVAHLRVELTGEALSTIANCDPREHCTHLFDLAILCAAHAGDVAPRKFDMKVSDRIEDRTIAMLHETIGTGDSIERMCWQINGLEIEAPHRFAGLSLKELSRWKRKLPPADAEYAAMLRRAIFVSGVRHFEPSPNETAAQRDSRMGVCYNYQLPQAKASRSIPHCRRDFSHAKESPLDNFDPSEFNELTEEAEANQRQPSRRSTRHAAASVGGPRPRPPRT